MSTYQLEQVHAGRAACKKCKEKITKEDIRLGVISIVKDMEMKSFYHPKCYKVPKEFTTEEFLDEKVNDKDGILEDESIRATILEDLDYEPPKVKKDKKSSAEDDVTSLYIKQLAARAEAYEESHHDEEHVDKKIKLDDKVSHKMNEINAYLFYQRMTIAELQDICRYNKVPHSGKKTDILLRCIDGHVNGRLGLCETCSKGKLKIGPDGKKVICSGYFDEVYNSCHAVLDLNQVKRYQPWYTTAPSEEELKEIDKILDSEVKDVVDASEPLPEAFVAAAKSIDWKVGTKDEIRSTNQKFISLLIGEISPIDCGSDPDKIKIDVGKILNENKESGLESFLHSLVAKFGMKMHNMKLEGDRVGKYASLCHVAANAEIYALMLDFEKIHRDQKNGFKANAYSKAAESIKHLKFEITESNALTLGKPGKNKVPGIGKGISQNMEEFLRTGVCSELEELRA